MPQRPKTAKSRRSLDHVCCSHADTACSMLPKWMDTLRRQTWTYQCWSTSNVQMRSFSRASSWKELLLGLRKRSLNGVEFVVSDDHAGLRRAIQEVLPEAVC